MAAAAGKPVHPLDQLTDILERQRAALDAGDADVLPGLTAELNGCLSQLQAAQGHTLPAPVLSRLATLRQRAQSNLDIALRRQQGTERSLEALGSGSEALQDAQARRIYAPAGQLSAPSLRGRALGRA